MLKNGGNGTGRSISTANVENKTTAVFLRTDAYLN